MTTIQFKIKSESFDELLREEMSQTVKETLIYSITLSDDGDGMRKC